MKKTQDMSFIEKMNYIINYAYNLNYRCLCVLEQQKKADEFNVSRATRVWLDSKHDAYAESRQSENERNRKFFNNVLEISIAELELAKRNLWKSYILEHKGTTKKFEDCFNNEEILDEELQKEFNDFVSANDKSKNTATISAYELYYQCIVVNRLVKEYVGIFDAIEGEISYDGYKNFFSNVDKNIKTLDSFIINDLNDCASMVAKMFPGMVLKQEAVMSKLLKTIAKDPKNKELLDNLEKENAVYEYLISANENAKLFKEYATGIVKRLEAANNSGLQISDKILETLLDVGFVASDVRKAKKLVNINEVYVSKTEINDLIMVAKHFSVAAPLIQRLSYVADFTTVVSQESVQQSLLMVNELKQLHKKRLKFFKENPTYEEENVGTKPGEEKPKTLKEKATPPQIAKHLAFQTAKGIVWFDGENCIDLEKNKVYSVAEAFGINQSDVDELESIYGDVKKGKVEGKGK